MGSCVSSVHSYGSKNESLALPLSPIKDKHINGAADPPITSWSPPPTKDHGSKEEVFFDSQAWLDSDCDDDFHSVRGDFTPSWGNTPLHQNFRGGTPSRGSTPVHQSTPSGTPQAPITPTTKKKMKLAELFRQTSVKEKSEDQQTNAKSEVRTTILDVLPSGEATPYASGMTSVASSERTANGDALIGKEKLMRPVQCCLPSCVSRSFSDRKKKMSPAITVNG